MPYRTDREALEARRSVLQRELDAVVEVRRREQALCDELRALERALRVGPLHALGIPVVSVPCDVPWSSMRGDDRARHCDQCQKNVFNLSAMSADEARRIVATGDACVRFFERADGTLLTADCGSERRKRRLRIVAAAVTTGALAAGLVAALASGRATSTMAPRSVDQLTIDPALVGHDVRVEGTLAPGSLTRAAAGEHHFALTGPRGTPLPVRYLGAVLPDTFRDVPGLPLSVVVEGELEPSGTFRAHQVMAKATQGYIVKSHTPAPPTLASP